MLPGRAVGVILVPIDTGCVGSVIVGIIIQGALKTFFPPCWDTPAVAHPILPGLGANERVLVFVLCLVVSLQIHRVGAERVQTGLGFAHRLQAIWQGNNCNSSLPSVILEFKVCLFFLKGIPLDLLQPHWVR